MNPAAIRLNLDCGGKQSATPVWLCRSLQKPKPKAPAPLRSAGALQNVFFPFMASIRVQSLEVLVRHEGPVPPR